MKVEPMVEEREGLDVEGEFVHRHIGPSPAEIEHMLGALGYRSLEELTVATVPGGIRLKKELDLPPAGSEHQVLEELHRLADRNQVQRSLIGMGYAACVTPAVIQRNILENPGWYTQYTPYQAEIAQGRLEALMNFQTLVADLTGLPVANASLLDEASAAAEAMAMCRAATGGERPRFVVVEGVHPQSLAVMRTRAAAVGMEIQVAAAGEVEVTGAAGLMLQCPATDGRVWDYRELVDKAHAAGALVVVGTDLLALTLFRPPGEYGADIAIGSAQRLGMPMGFGGPHAAFLAAKQAYMRRMPGRLVGLSKDVHGRPAYRLAIQTREQHIRREKATSNICTAQALPAIVAGMYVVYHGPEGLKAIAARIQGLTGQLAAGLAGVGVKVGGDGAFFDTLRVSGPGVAGGLAAARGRGFNLRDFGDGSVGISLDERSDAAEVATLLACFGVPPGSGGDSSCEPLAGQRTDSGGSTPEGTRSRPPAGLPAGLARQSAYLTHPVFHSYHCEHEMLRYLKRLESRDLSLTTSMIPLGSCTMKLNPAAAMLPITWPQWADVHPYVPAEQAAGYAELCGQLGRWLGEITGLPAVSLQPNAGSQGEYSGLLAIRGYHAARGQGRRKVCLIPVSAHGTNPASAVVAGLEVVAVACDERGNIDVADLQAKAQAHQEDLAGLMVTYPSTHGVFEEAIREMCIIVHRYGGLVYMDGANMNAQVGLCRPGEIGADVCHLNLHKTFCIPHGGGGPGIGPIGVASHLAPFLPNHPLRADAGPATGIGPVSAAPFGSLSVGSIITVPATGNDIVGAWKP